MSIINQMLRDLDARRAEGEPKGQAALRGLAVGGQVSRRRAWVLLWALLVVVVALAGTLVHVVAGERTPVVAAPAAPTPPLATMPQNPDLEPSEAVAVPPKAREPQVLAVAQMHPTPKPASAPNAPQPSAAKPPQSAATISSARSSPVTSPDEAPPSRIEKQRRALTPTQKVHDAMAKASNAVRRGDRVTAERALRSALAIEPGHTGARELLAKVYIASGRVVEARALLAEGIDLQPRHVGLRKLHARVLVEQGELGAAVSLLGRDRPAAAVDPEYWALLAGLAYQHADYPTARTSYQELVKYQPDSGTWWLGLGMTAEAQGDEDAAREAYQRALQSGSLSPSLKQFAQSRLPSLPGSPDTL